MAEETREAEASYTASDFAARLRRLADALDAGGPFWIRFAGERFQVPANAQLSIEYEREDGEEEVEFQLKWRTEDGAEAAHDEHPEV